MYWIGTGLEVAGLLCIVVGAAILIAWMMRRPEAGDIAALPWWYCPYCGSIFNHTPTGGPCAIEPLIEPSGYATPATGNPAE